MCGCLCGVCMSVLSVRLCECVCARVRLYAFVCSV